MTFPLICALAWIPQGSPCASQPEAIQLGQGTQGTDGVPALVFEGAPLLEHPMALRAESLAPGTGGLMIVAAQSLPILLPPYGATLFPSPPFTAIPFAADASGNAPLAEVPSLPPALCGAELVAQALVLDVEAAGGVAFTRGIRLAIGSKKPKAPFDNYAVPMGVGPNELVAGDLNLDGSFDLVSACQDGVLVAIGSGKGDFRPAQEIHNVRSSAVVVGLVNADSFPDIVAVRDNGDELWVFLGDGSGSFDSMTTLTTIDDPVSIDLGDFNDDGRTDVAVASDGEGLAVHFGQPAAAFGPFQVLSSAERLYDLVVADYDGDGVDDVAACDVIHDALIVRLGSPSGVLTVVPDSVTGTCPDQIVAGDWNGDGDVDLMSVECGIGGVTKLAGNGDGTFGIVGSNLFPSKAVGRMALSDLDGDTVLDLIYADLSTDVNEPSLLTSHLGDGNGGFTEVDAVAIAPFPDSVVVADLDEDGTSDVITMVNQGAMVTYGDGGGLLSEPVEVETLSYPRGIVAADLDGDGRDDLAVTGLQGVTVYRGQASGFSALDPVDLGINCFEIAAARIDADTVLDLVVTAREADTVVMLPGLGDGTFGAAVSVPTGERPEDVAVGDLDGDGFADVASLSTDSDDITVALGDGSGGFAAGPVLPLGSGTFGLDLGDLNADGNLDIVGTRSLGEVRIFLGTGAGSFAPGVDIAVTFQLTDLALVDIDADGTLDIVGSTANHLAKGAWVLRGLGDGTFAGVEQHSSPNRPSRVQVADLDGDRRLDLVMFGGNNLFDQTVVLRGLEGGGFAPPLSFMVGDDPNGLAIGRLGDDLIPDLFVTRYDDLVLVLENRLLD